MLSCVVVRSLDFKISFFNILESENLKLQDELNETEKKLELASVKSKEYEEKLVSMRDEND